MNWVRRAVAEIASRNRLISHPNSLIGQSYLSTQAKKVAGDLPRPSEIPYQVKVANTVNLIGYVDMPVQFKSSSNGKAWAATIINQIPSSHSPPLWVPIIFEGDLAHIAACHLKPNDHVHIAGQLIADSPPDEIQRNANVQVMVHSVNFVEQYSQTKKCFASHKQEEAAVNDSVSKRKDKASVFSSWNDLLENPKDWWDCRSKKLKGLVKPRYPDFKRKDGTDSLWLNTAPKQILPELDKVEFDVQTNKPTYFKQRKVEFDVQPNKSTYPKQCKGVEFDVQTNKSTYPKQRKGVEFDVQTNKSTYPKQPKGVEFDVQTNKSTYPKQRKGDESWKDLVENPDKWWDNRHDKMKERSPDFKHKETGEALWLTTSPAWVLSKLPAPKSKRKSPTAKSNQNAVTGKKDTILS